MTMHGGPKLDGFLKPELWPQRRKQLILAELSFFAYYFEAG